MYSNSPTKKLISTYIDPVRINTAITAYATIPEGMLPDGCSKVHMISLHVHDPLVNIPAQVRNGIGAMVLKILKGFRKIMSQVTTLTVPPGSIRSP